MSPELKDKVSLVTGGARGIGYGIARALLVEGARVFICGRDEAVLKTAIDTLRLSERDQIEGIWQMFADMRIVARWSARRPSGSAVWTSS